MDKNEKYKLNGNFLNKGIVIYLIIAMLIFFAMQMMYLNNNVAYGEAGNISDNDSLTRMARVMDLHGDNSWYDTSMHRVNPPHGHVQHWSRPVDAILYIGALALSPLQGFDFQKGLVLWANILPPLLMFGLLLAMFWAALPILDSERRIYYAHFILLQITIVANFLPGRIDQGNWLLLIYVLILGFVIRLLTAPQNGKFAFFAGITMALGLWFSVELIHPIIAIWLILGILWLIYGRECSPNILNAARGFAIGLIIFLIAERSPIDAIEHYYETDRISLFYVTFGFCNWLFWEISRAFEKYLKRDIHIIIKILSGVVAGGVIFIIMAKMLPGLWHGNVFAPELQPEDAYRQTRLGFIEENDSVFDLDVVGKNGLATAIFNALIFAAPYYLGLPILLVLALVKTGKERLVWIAMILQILAFTQRGTEMTLRVTSFINIAGALALVYIPYSFGKIIRPMISTKYKTAYVVSVNIVLIIAIYIYMIPASSYVKEEMERMALNEVNNAEISEIDETTEILETETEIGAEIAIEPITITENNIDIIEPAPAFLENQLISESIPADFNSANTIISENTSTIIETTETPEISETTEASILPEERKYECATNGLIPWLNYILPSDNMQVIMTHPDVGPDILALTPHAVLSIPNHRPQPGHTASYNAFNAVTDADALGFINEVNADILVLCINDGHAMNLFYGTVNDTDNTFSNRILRGELPDWLEEIPAPNDYWQRQWRIFRILKSEP